MIVVEGPDGSGKTRLLRKITKEFEVWPEPRPVSNTAVPMVPLPGWVEEQLVKGPGFRMYDRFALISCMCYIDLPNPTYNHWGQMHGGWKLFMDQWERFKAIDPLVIVCMPPLRMVLNHVCRPGDNEVVAPYIRTIYEHYEEFIRSYQSFLDLHVYDFSNPLSVENVMAQVNNRKGRYERPS